MARQLASCRPLASRILLLAMLTVAARIGPELGFAHVASAEPPPTFAPIAEAITPAVINITAVIRDGAPQGELEDLFEGELRSLGSGVIVDPAGIAVTNAHLIRRATDLEAITVDGRRHRASIVGIDRKSDLAVLRLADGKVPFPHARLGDSDRMQVGDWVIAIGSPYGLQATVTVGIVSAKARQVGQGPLDDFLQTDAAINPGNSGGPLVSMLGEVVGINTAMIAGSSGIGFAIPSNLVKRIYPELLEKGRVTRAWLGVTIQPLTPELARAFHAPRVRALLVADVMPESPAAKAGLKPGDILLEINGQLMRTTGDFERSLARAAPGQPARLGLWRDGREKTVEARLGEEPDERRARGGERATRLLGLEVRPITPEMGVMVERVEPGSSAEDAGIEEGDVVREVDRHPVRTIGDFERLTKRLKEGERVTMLLQRGDTAFYVSLAATAG